jgi:hypothetical protein
MKIHPDGVVEGSPEEIAAYQHISAAMDRTDVARTKRQAAQAKPRPKKAPAKKRNLKAVPALLETAKGLDDGDGVTASKLADTLGIDRKAAYNKLYSLMSQGHAALEGGRFTFPKKETVKSVEAQAI